MTRPKPTKLASRLFHAVWETSSVESRHKSLAFVSPCLVTRSKVSFCLVSNVPIGANPVTSPSWSRAPDRYIITVNSRGEWEQNSGRLGIFPGFVTEVLSISGVPDPP